MKLESFTRAAWLATSLLLSCQRAPAKPAAVHTPSAPEPPSARLHLAQSRYDLGAAVQDEPVHREIPVTNAGAIPLQIDAIQRSRFCSASIDHAIIAPGATGQLHVTCVSDLYGPMRESLQLHSNDPRAETTTLDLVAEVTPRLAFDTPLVDLAMPFGEQRSQDVHLVGTQIQRASITLKDSGILGISTIEALRGPKGTPPSFRIHCTGKMVGRHVGNLIVSTGLPRPKEIAMPYTCKVAGTLEVSPTNPYVNLKVSGPKIVFIEVRSTQPGFQVHGVRVTEGPFEAAIEGQLSERAYRIRVKVIEARLVNGARSATGKLMVFSNDRTEPEKEIPLLGLGKLNPAPP